MTEQSFGMQGTWPERGRAYDCLIKDATDQRLLKNRDCILRSMRTALGLGKVRLMQTTKIADHQWSNDLELIEGLSAQHSLSESRALSHGT